MARAARLVASATVGSLIAFGAPLLASAQTEPASTPVVRTSQAAGVIIGTVKDDHGQAIASAVVSAVGATTAIVVTDKSGHFEFGPLPPGEYLLRAHLAGYVAPRGLSVRVNASGQATSAITLSRATSAAPILAAGVGTLPSTGTATPNGAVGGPDEADASTVPPADNHSETAWRIRHARRSVLKDVTIPVELLTDDDDHGSGSGFVPVQVVGKAVGSSAHIATSLFSDSSLSGQVNLLTTGSFDSPQDLFSTDMLSRNIAYVRVGAPVGTDGIGRREEPSTRRTFRRGSSPGRTPADRSRQVTITTSVCPTARSVMTAETC